MVDSPLLAEVFKWIHCYFRITELFNRLVPVTDNGVYDYFIVLAGNAIDNLIDCCQSCGSLRRL